MALSLLGGVLVSVIFVFCVLAVVMAALRPSLFSSFVRGFRSEDTKSDEGIQEPLKFINWKKGFFRLTLVLSILFGIVSGIFSADFALIWLIYFATGFIIRGFASKR